MTELERWLEGPTGTLVNATPLGWNSDDPFPGTPPEGWSFVDLNYNPRWTWRNGLTRRGVRVRTGEEMLVEQGALSFRFWTGIAVTEAVRQHALEAVRRVFRGHHGGMA